MSRKLLILLFFLINISMQSQELVWTTNMVDAIKQNNETSRPMLIFFKGTKEAQKLQNEVFNTSVFEEWCERKLVLVELDLSENATSTEERYQNIVLKNSLGVENLLQVCFANANMKNGQITFNVLGKFQYNLNGVQGWISDSDLILEKNNN